MNLPNRITLSRICLIPLVMFFFMADFIPYGKLIAAVIFAVAALTDNIDGRIARKRNLVTDLGKFLDPIADKVLVMAGFLLLIAWPLSGVEARVASIYPYWLGILCVAIVFAREFIVSGFRQLAASKRIVLAAEKTGKVKAALQDVTIILYMLWSFVRVEFYETIKNATTANLIVEIALIALLVVSTFLTIFSGIKYIVKYRAVFKDEPINNLELAVVPTKRDEIFVNVLKAVIENKGASTTFIQRKFSVGYSRAGRIMDQLEKEGFITSQDPKNPSMAREVLISQEEFERMFKRKAKVSKEK